MSLKIIVVPPAHKLQWTSRQSLIKSFLKSQALSIRGNSFSDAQRKTIGHVVAKIECSSVVRWSSISINPVNMVPLLLKKGINGMFTESSNGYMQSEDDIKRFVVNNEENAIVMKFPLNQQACERMLMMDDFHRAQKQIWFGPMIDTLSSYRSSSRMGGSGSTYAVALKELDQFTNVDLNQWLEKIQLPGHQESLSFYSAQSMWEFASLEMKSALHRKFREKVRYKHKMALLKGLEF